MSTTARETALVLWFDELGLDDVPLVGGKNASLGEMYRELRPEGIAIPNGFATTSAAYRFFLTETGLEQKICDLVAELEPDNIQSLQRCGAKIRETILATPIPESLADSILDAYDRLCEQTGAKDVAVRSSATAEDLPNASFAGQQETYLNVQGHSGILESCRRCFASLFTDRAISYRAHQGFDQLGIALSIGIQQMVRSDLGTSGVMFSIDTESGFADAVLINAAYGLGENVVQGSVTPDEFYVFKPTLMEGCRPILRRHMGTKEFKLIYDMGGSRMTRNVPVPEEARKRFAIGDEDILQLARWACQIEEHYSEKRGVLTPMDMEWAKDGRTGELFIVQARPETVQSRRDTDRMQTYRLQSKGKLLVEGRAVGERIGQGRVRIVKDVHHLDTFNEGEILVADKTDPDWEPIMKKASAIVTNRGGRTCHAAIVSRELGVPAIVGAESATEKLITGQEVTISCAEGERGVVYEGLLPFEVEEIELTNVERPSTKIMMNVGNPEEAFHLSHLPCDGVGLAREEFIITTYVQVHPLALLDYDQITNPETKKQIDDATQGYDDKTQFFLDKLSEGVGTIAAAFYPKDVIVRLSDFKTNEYASLVGGAAYEPAEENPMIGFRGASRYYHPDYRAAFELECQALANVRKEMGLTNLKVMVPFCRTITEAKEVLAVMEAAGLKRGDEGLEIYVMCELPSNVILAEQFAEYFDGFSIGSNDLTQLTLGVDRDSEIVAPVFDERDPAVFEMIRMAIERVKGKGRKIGICGQAPSDYPEVTQFLIEQGIDSISLTPDVVLKTTLAVLEVEKQLDRAPAEPVGT